MIQKSLFDLSEELLPSEPAHVVEEAPVVQQIVSPDQATLFEMPREWEELWQGMPEFKQDDLMPWQSVKVHFRTLEDRQRFAELVGQSMTNQTKYLWYPKPEIAGRMTYVSSKKCDPVYPIYIISKGRWESRLTSKALEEIHVPYHIVVEPQEFENYANVIDSRKIIVLPFSNLGLGSIPARNFVWEHALERGAKRHWILDDNIGGFIRQNNNVRLQIKSGVCFRAIEDFADRYENVMLAGMNYRFFAPARSEQIPPFYLNTRIYSCILIDNSISHRWRGRYNEDTDLSLRVLKDGHCTVLFNAFKINKSATMIMKGGNTDELYKDDGRLKMAESLKEQHPDVVTITRKWNRWQHHVDYSRFKKNQLRLRSGASTLQGIDEYGLELEAQP